MITLKQDFALGYQKKSLIHVIFLILDAYILCRFPFFLQTNETKKLLYLLFQLISMLPLV